jgi:hypothetical protein
LNTFYRFFIEVPPGLSRLKVELFDPDVGAGGTAEAAQGRDRARTGFNSSVQYSLIRPDGTSAATLKCDATTSCLDNAWQALLDSTTAQNTAAGHWELRVDMSSSQTSGDDVNALGIRASDGTTGSGGTELNIYAESPYPIGVNPPVTGVNTRTYTAYPYITNGCSCSENDFDYDSDQGNVGSILLMSRTMAFSQTINSTSLSANNAWARNNLTGWTTDSQSGDYGIWTGSIAIKSYVDSGGAQNGNLADVYFADFAAAANPITSNSPQHAFRIYLPNDSGTAPVKPYVEQTAARVSGPNPPAVGQTTKAVITVNVVNPTSNAITFSATNLVIAHVPGSGVVYGGSPFVSQGVVISQPAVGGTGSIDWNPGTLPAGATATLTYQISFTPNSAFQRMSLTSTPASGNGTTAQWVDETGNTTQTRATYLFGPLCELAATQGLLLPCAGISSSIAGATTICPGGTANLSVTIAGGSSLYTVTLSNGDVRTGSSPLSFPVSPTSTQGYSVSSGSDSAGCPISSSAGTVTVGVRPAITFTTTNLNPSCPGALNGGISVNASGGTGALTYSDNGGSSFQASAAFAGLGAGTYSVVAKDSAGCISAPSFVTLTDPPAIDVGPTFIPAGTQSTPYPPTSFSQTNGVGSVTFTESGALPVGITLSAGVLSGATAQTGSFPITITATDQLGCSGSRQYLLVIACGSTSVSVGPASIPSGTINAAYPATTFNPTGGSGPYTVTLTGSLPSGMNFTSGALSGTPTQSGIFAITIAATDASGCTGKTDYLLAIACSATAISISPGSVGPGTGGAFFAPVNFTPSGGSAPYKMFLAGSLPAGMTFSSGTLSGTPTQIGTFNFTVGASDSNGCNGTQSYTLVIGCQPIIFSPQPSAVVPAGAIFTPVIFSVTTGVGPITFSESGALPTGMTFSAGVLSGTPTQTGTFNITVTATDQNGCTGSLPYQIVVICAPVIVNPPGMYVGPAGVALPPITFTQTGGLGTITYSETGALPTGVTLSSGVLSGTPTQAGSFSIDITATDQNGCFGTLPGYKLVITCPSIAVAPATISGGTAGVAFAPVTFSQTGGVGTITYSESGALPTGMTFSAGVLSGKPTQTGTFNITVTATDQNGCTGIRPYTLVINCPAITVGPPAISAGTAGVAYTPVASTQSGGVGTITFSESGALPMGMTFTGGVLSGTPTQTGSFPITVTATDQNGCTGGKGYTLVINCPTITVSPASISPGTAGVLYSPVTFAQTGGVGTTTLSEGGALPTGMTFSGGALSGTPTQTGSFNITVMVTDQNGCTGSKGYTLVINCPTITVGPASLSGGTAGAPYTPVTFMQTGGVGTTTLAETGALPTGMTFSGGVLSGTPTQTGSFNITVTATDSNGCFGNSRYTLVINCPTITVGPALLSGGTAGVLYSPVTFTQTGGVGTTTLAETGALPAGMAFSGGVLSGTPTQTGSFNITVTATDSNGCSGNSRYTLVINCPTITVGPASLSSGTAGVAYTPVTFTQTGGVGTTIISESGALPTGMSFSGGILSGTPTQTGSFNITVTATDSNGCPGTTRYTLMINCPAITVGPASLSSGTAGLAYTPVTFTQTGGVGTTIISESGALPTGMSFSGGVLSGTPAQTGSFNITVTATDQNGCTGSNSYTVTIACATITVGPSNLPAGTAGVAYTPLTFTQSGGLAAITFSESGALPSGMTFSAGVLSGTPLQTGSFPISVTATDRNGCAGTQKYVLVVNCPKISINPAAIPQGTAGVPYAPTQFSQTGGVGTITYSESGTLPTGMVLSSSGLLSGTPLQTGSFNITVTGTDANGCTGKISYTLVINCPVITVNPTSVPAAVQYVAYSTVQFTQAGGVGAVTFSTASSLPAGMSLSPAGVLSGTATQAGSFSITVTATDGNGCTGSAAVSLSVTALDRCLKDDSTGNFVQFNSITGDYLFTVCGPYGFALVGRGTLSVVNSVIVISDNKPDRRVSIQYNLGQLTGKATLTRIVASGLYQTFSLNDTNPHPVCGCGA